MAQDKKISKPARYQTSDGTPVWLRQEFVSEVDENGKYVPGSTTTNLRYYPNAFSDDYVTIATRKSGENWKYNNVKELGPDLKKTLSNKNSMLNVNLNNATFQTMGQKIPFPAVESGYAKQNRNTNTDIAAAAGISAPAEKPEDADVEGIDLTESLEVREGTKIERFGEYKYPENLGSTTQDIVKFDMLKYEARNFETGQDSFEFKDRQKLGQGERQSIGNVILPVPAGIRDDNGVDWGNKTLNPLELAAADLAIGGITGGAAGFNASLSKTVRKAMGASGDLKEAITGIFGGAATGIGQQLLTRSTGAILNPNMELLFNGPTLRSFTFTYKLSARSESEAKQIIGIIRFFKQGMAAQRTKSGIFLNSPNTFQVRYILRGNNDQDHPYIGRMKECALQRFSVNYTPENNYATYEDGYMVSYEINMQFQELEPIYNDDYQSVNGIGY